MISLSIKILSIDPSMSCVGWAYYNGETAQINAGFYMPEDYISVHNWMQNYFKEHDKIDIIILEDYFYNSRFAMGSNVNSEIRGIFKLVFAQNSKKWVMSVPSKWKSFVTDMAAPLLTGNSFIKLRSPKSKAKKWRQSLKRKYGKAKANKIIIYDALALLGVNFPPNMVHNNRKVKFKYDVSDAIGILICYLNENKLPYDLKNITWDFEIREGK